MRVSCTTLESFRLFMDEANEWFNEEELIASIKGEFVPNHKINLGSAFGKVLEDPDQFLAPGGFRITVCGEQFEFGRDVMEPCLALMDRRGVFEAKATKQYGRHTVVAKADQLVGAHLIEHKTTLSGFKFEKYSDSYQWRFMADLFQPVQITYHVFCLDEAENGVISLKGIESFNLYPYEAVHRDCCALLDGFVRYVQARGLERYLERSGELSPWAA